MEAAEVYTLSGPEYQWIREQAGFRRRDLADLIARESWRQKITTPAGVAYLEGRPIVRDRYIDCLVRLLGRKTFERWYNAVRERRERRMR